MCSSVPVLRLLAFLILLIAYVACLVGFFSPFWIELHPPTRSSSLSSFLSSSQLPDTPSTLPSSPSPSLHSTFSLPALTNHIPPSRIRNNTVRSEDYLPERIDGGGGGEEAQRMEGEEKERAPVNVTSGAGDRMYEGLWAKCDENFVCRCFAQDNFRMEKEFPGWHKAVQGLFAIGLLFLLITLLIGGFYLCCRCCKASISLATVLGAFALAGFLPIALSIVIYGGFAKFDFSRNIAISGDDSSRFAWGFFLSIAGALVVPLAAILYFIAGRRKEVLEHEDCETAKMV